MFGGALFLGSPLGSSYRVEDGGTETLLVGKLQPAGVQLDSAQDTITVDHDTPQTPCDCFHDTGRFPGMRSLGGPSRVSFHFGDEVLDLLQ